jgi:hypothetical protein
VIVSVLVLVISACGSGGSKPTGHLSIVAVQRVFAAHHFPVLNTGCSRLALNYVTGNPNKWKPRYAPDPGLVCQLANPNDSLKVYADGTVVEPAAPEAMVASDDRLIGELLSYPASRSELYGEPGGPAFQSEHFVISNVVVDLGENSAHTRIPPVEVRRVKAIVATLTRLATLKPSTGS